MLLFLRLMKLLLTADAAEGGTAANVGADAGGRPAGDGAPPAGQTVATGRHTEAENELRTKLDSEQKAHATTAADKKAREQRIAELEDELHRVKAAQTVTAPAAWRYRPFKRTEKKAEA